MANSVGEAKVSCMLCHLGVQLILVYSWQGLLSLKQIIVEGGGMFLFLLFTVIHFPLSPLSLSFISSAISSISLLPSSGKQHKMTHKGWHVAKPQHNQRPWSDATFCCIWSGCTLFAKAYLSQLIDWLSWGLMTLQPLWVILCHLPEKVEDR